MNRTSVIFTAPGKVALQEEPVAEPGYGEVMVKTLISAISAGTEMLVYRGQFPRNMAVDETITALDGTFGYPMPYGYAAVGEVEAVGPEVSADWLGRSVFAFHPHQSRFIVPTDQLIRLPGDLDPLDGVFIPNMETAVNLVMDARPILGESAMVFGQGVVGLLVTALLNRFPLSALFTLDPCETRRRISLDLGADAALDPQQIDGDEVAQQLVAHKGGNSEPDLVFEISGDPSALDQAIALAGFDTRIVAGSWYGAKQVGLDLGGAFHRRRIQMISSQVSTIAPNLSGRWCKARRFEVVMNQIRTIEPQRLITHRYPLEKAAQAYQLLDGPCDGVLQVVFTYD